MPTDQNTQHSRRPHYHRGRRGPDRRGGERRPPSQQPESGGRDHLDIEQIMREIRVRVSERTGIDLSDQQIQELAARRLEAILDPRAIKPSLMDELRRAAGLPADAAPAEPGASHTFESSALYESPNGVVRFIRRLLNPLLRLFFNPDALVQAFDAQARLNKAAALREAEQRRRQAEWNALHFEILRRLVTDLSRTDIDAQQLALRIESLAAKVDFNERRVRAFEQAQHQAKPVGRAVETSLPPPATASPRDEIASPDRAPSADGAPDGGRRRRRRRRGRRSGTGAGPDFSGPSAGASAAGVSVDQIEQADGDDSGDDDLAPGVSSDLAPNDDLPVNDADLESARADVSNSGFQESGQDTPVEPVIETAPTVSAFTQPAPPDDSAHQASGLGDSASERNREAEGASLVPNPGSRVPGSPSEG